MQYCSFSDYSYIPKTVFHIFQFSRYFLHSKPLLYNNFDSGGATFDQLLYQMDRGFLCVEIRTFLPSIFFLGKSEKCRKYFAFQTIFECFWYKCISLSESLIEKICYFKQNSQIFSNVIKSLTHTLSGF